jgi:hypothetical protein
MKCVSVHPVPLQGAVPVEVTIFGPDGAVPVLLSFPALRPYLEEYKTEVGYFADILEGCQRDKKKLLYVYLTAHPLVYLGRRTCAVDPGYVKVVHHTRAPLT